jgi:hypothetical protein
MQEAKALRVEVNLPKVTQLLYSFMACLVPKGILGS